MRPISRTLAELQTRLDPKLVAALGSVAITLKRRERCRVRYLGGNWIHHYPTGTMVRPSLGGASARLADHTTSETFLCHYRPCPGDTIMDLGAGFGTEVRLLSRLAGPTGRVISVEAHPRAFACLEQTIALNRLGNVIAVQCAVHSRQGTVFLEDSADHNTNGLTSGAGIPVPARSLADFVEQFGLHRIDLLKMNIEGAELAVLEAARDLLPRIRNLVVSCHDFKADRGGSASQRTFEKVRALLTEAGYDLRTRQHDPRPWIPYYLYASR